jgi:hypothetical protein
MKPVSVVDLGTPHGLLSQLGDNQSYINIDHLSVEVERTEEDHGKRFINDIISATTAGEASDHMCNTTTEKHNLCHTYAGEATNDKAKSKFSITNNGVEFDSRHELPRGKRQEEACGNCRPRRTMWSSLPTQQQPPGHQVRVAHHECSLEGGGVNK